MPIQAVNPLKKFCIEPFVKPATKINPGVHRSSPFFKRKSLPREEVRQAFRKEPNNSWEEESCYSIRCPLGGGVGYLRHEALREEVHCFVGIEDS
jgi:hypothetical protein